MAERHYEMLQDTIPVLITFEGTKKSITYHIPHVTFCTIIILRFLVSNVINKFRGTQAHSDSSRNYMILPSYSYICGSLSDAHSRSDYIMPNYHLIHRSINQSSTHTNMNAHHAYCTTYT